MNRLSSAVTRLNSSVLKALSSRAKTDGFSAASGAGASQPNDCVKLTRHQNGLRIGLNNALKEVTRISQYFISAALNAKKASKTEYDKTMFALPKPKTIFDKINEADLKLQGIDDLLATHLKTLIELQNNANCDVTSKVYDSTNAALQKVLQNGIHTCRSIFYQVNASSYFDRDLESLKVEGPDLRSWDQKTKDYIEKMNFYKAGLIDWEFLKAEVHDESRKILDQVGEPKSILKVIDDAEWELLDVNDLESFNYQVIYEFKKTIGHWIDEDAAGRHVHHSVFLSLNSTPKRGIAICEKLIEKIVQKDCYLKSERDRYVSANVGANRLKAMERAIGILNENLESFNKILSDYKLSMRYYEVVYSDCQDQLDKYPIKRPTENKVEVTKETQVDEVPSKIELIETIEQYYQEQQTELENNQRKIYENLMHEIKRAERDGFKFAQRQKELAKCMANQADQDILKAKMKCYRYFLQLDEEVGFSENYDNEDEVYRLRGLQTKFRVE